MKTGGFNLRMLLGFGLPAIALLIVGGIAWTSPAATSPIDIGAWVMRTLPLIVALILLGMLFSGFKQVGPQEVGVVVQFGKPILQVDSGLAIVPFAAIWKLHIEKKLIIEEEFPGKTASQNDGITVTHGASNNQYSNDPLDKRVTTALSVVIRYQIKDLKAFISTIGGRSQFRDQIRELMLTAAQIECAKQSVKDNYQRLAEINKNMFDELSRQTKEWGIQLNSVQIPNIDLGGSVSHLLGAVTSSSIQIDIDKNKYEGSVHKARAEAEVTKALMLAKAVGYKELSESLKIPEAMIAYRVDAIERIYKNKQFNMITPDVANMIEALYHAMESGKYDDVMKTLEKRTG